MSAFFVNKLHVFIVSVHEYTLIGTFVCKFHGKSVGYQRITCRNLFYLPTMWNPDSSVIRSSSLEHKGYQDWQTTPLSADSIYLFYMIRRATDA